MSALMRNVFLRDRRGGPWTPPAHLRYEDVAFAGNADARLAGWWFPHERPKGAVVLAHPDKRYGKHWFVRSGWVDFLHAHGYEALAFDFPGYGASHGPIGHFHEDVAAAAEFAKRWAGGLPVHVVGVSQGAFAVANAAPLMPFVRSLVLESPYPSVRAWWGDRREGRLIDVLDALFPRTARAIRADANVARATAARVLVVAAGADDVTPAALSLRVADAVPEAKRDLLVVDGANHLEPFASAEYRRRVLETFAAAEGRRAPA